MLTFLIPDSFMWYLSITLDSKMQIAYSEPVLSWARFKIWQKHSSGASAPQIYAGFSWYYSVKFVSVIFSYIKCLLHRFSEAFTRILLKLLYIQLSKDFSNLQFLFHLFFREFMINTPYMIIFSFQCQTSLIDKWLWYFSFNLWHSYSIFHYFSWKPSATFL